MSVINHAVKRREVLADGGDVSSEAAHSCARVPCKGWHLNHKVPSHHDRNRVHPRRTDTGGGSGGKANATTMDKEMAELFTEKLGA